MLKAIFLLTVLCPLVNCVCTGCTDYSLVELDDPKFKEIVDATVEFINGDHNLHFNLQKIVEITGGEQSVCSVKKLCGETASYRFNGTVGETECLKSKVSYKDLANCKLQKDANIFECEFEVTKAKDGHIDSQSSKCVYKRKP